MSELDNSVIWLAHYHIFPPGEKFRITYYTSRFFFWCKSGHGKITVDGHSYDVSVGNVCLLKWGQTVTYDSSTEDQLIIGCIHLIPNLEGDAPFDPEQIFWTPEPGNPDFERRKDAYIDSFSQFFFGWQPDNSTLLQFANYLAATMQENQPLEFRHSAASIFLRELTLCRNNVAARQDTLPVALREILNYIELNIEHKISMKTLVHRSGLSSSTIYRLFKDYLECNVTEWTLKRKIQHACELLRTTTLPINLISQRVGIDDQYYFSKLMKKHLGMPATQYRKKYAFHMLY